MPTPRHLLSIAVACAILAPPAISQAQKRIIVLDVEGARDNKLRDSLAEVVGEENRIISSAKYRRAARKLKTRRVGTAHFKKVAARLEADGVLQALVIDEGKRYALKLRLREGSTGRTVKKLTIKLSNPRLSSPVRRKLAKKLLPAIDDLRFAESADADAEVAAEDVAGDGDDDELAARRDRRAARAEARREAKRRKAERERERREKARKAKAERRERARRDRERRAAEEAEDELEDDGDFDEEPIDDEDFDDEDREETDVAMADGGDDFDDEEEPGARKRLDTSAAADAWTAADRRRAGALALSGGITVINRRLAFTPRADLVDAPQGYSGPPAPAGHVSGELYPLALDRKRKGLGAKIGIAFEVDQVFGLSTVVDDGVMQVTLPTAESRYGAGLVLRHSFGSKATSPSVKLSAGYNRLSFSVAPNDDIVVDLPNTSYTYFDPGLELRVPVSGKLAFFAGGEAMLVTASGEMQRRDQYGSAKITGFEGAAGAEYMIGKHFMVQARARYAAIGFEFTGDGDMVVMRDGDPTTVDVGGALDTYMTGTISLGYLY